MEDDAVEPLCEKLTKNSESRGLAFWNEPKMIFVRIYIYIYICFLLLQSYNS